VTADGAIPVPGWQSGGRCNLPLDLIRPREQQPQRRTAGRDFERLVQSIRERGVLRPIRVRPCGDGYRIVAGERRWRAAREVGLEHIPAIVTAVEDDNGDVDALIERVRRHDVNAVDRAQSLVRLRTLLGLQSWDEVGRLAGISRQHVYNLLNASRLPEPMRQEVRAGDLTGQHARALAHLRGQAGEQLDLWSRIRAERLSGPGAMAAVRELRTDARGGPAAGETAIRDRLRSKVEETLSSLSTADVHHLAGVEGSLAELHRRLDQLLDGTAPRRRRRAHDRADLPARWRPASGRGVQLQQLEAEEQDQQVVGVLGVPATQLSDPP
jgi:ParB family transcriptional regulator, chromosome partitioning protein